MKRFLCAGEGYAPFPTNINYWLPRYFPAWRAPFLYIFVLFMCLQAVEAKETDPASNGGREVFSAAAKYQTADGLSKYSKLQIGQKVPQDVRIGYPVFNTDREEVSTRDFRRRAVIIDIWATWCGSCVSEFPKMDSLHRVYAAYLDIYLLNNLYRDSEEKIRLFLSDYKEKFPAFSLPLIIGNVDTRALFPGSTLPHYVWIDANGRVKAITGRRDVTGANIERLIAGLSIDAKEKMK